MLKTAKWADHVVRRGYELAKLDFYKEPRGTSRRGRQRQRWMDLHIWKVFPAIDQLLPILSQIFENSRV